MSADLERDLAETLVDQAGTVSAGPRLEPYGVIILGRRARRNRIVGTSAAVTITVLVVLLGTTRFLGRVDLGSPQFAATPTASWSTFGMDYLLGGRMIVRGDDDGQVELPPSLQALPNLELVRFPQGWLVSVPRGATGRDLAVLDRDGVLMLQHTAGEWTGLVADVNPEGNRVAVSLRELDPQGRSVGYVGVYDLPTLTEVNRYELGIDEYPLSLALRGDLVVIDSPPGGTWPELMRIWNYDQDVVVGKGATRSWGMSQDGRLLRTRPVDDTICPELIDLLGTRNDVVGQCVSAGPTYQVHLAPYADTLVVYDDSSQKWYSTDGVTDLHHVRAYLDLSGPARFEFWADPETFILSTDRGYRMCSAAVGECKLVPWVGAESTGQPIGSAAA